MLGPHIYLNVVGCTSREQQQGPIHGRDGQPQASDWWRHLIMSTNLMFSKLENNGVRAVKEVGRRGKVGYSRVEIIYPTPFLHIRKNVLPIQDAEQFTPI